MTAATKLKMIAALIAALEESGEDDDEAAEGTVAVIKALVEAGKKKA